VVLLPTLLGVGFKVERSLDFRDVGRVAGKELLEEQTPRVFVVVDRVFSVGHGQEEFLRFHEQLVLLRTLREEDFVLGVPRPHHQIVDEELVILVYPFCKILPCIFRRVVNSRLTLTHVQFRQVLHYRPLGVGFHVILVHQQPRHVRAQHFLVDQQRFRRAVGREHLDEQLLNVRLFDLLHGHSDLFRFDPRSFILETEEAVICEKARTFDRYLKILQVETLGFGTGTAAARRRLARQHRNCIAERGIIVG
jgi:hypothetical protein